MTGLELFEAIRAALGPEAHRHRGVDAPARRDVAIAGGSYRAPGALVDGFRAGDADVEMSGVVVTARASTAVLHRAKELGANLVITRQAFLGDSQDRPVANPEPALAHKLAFIGDNAIVVLRLQDPRTGPMGRMIAGALAAESGLGDPEPGPNLADGLIYGAKPVAIVDLIRRIKAALPTETVRLVGDPALRVSGIALATETSRPNALAPLLALPQVELLIAGEVHETETSVYVQDAIALGQRKALLLIGSIPMEEPGARALARWLKSIAPCPVTYVAQSDTLFEVA